MLAGVDVVGVPAARHPTGKEAINSGYVETDCTQARCSGCWMHGGGIIQACNAFRPGDRPALSAGVPCTTLFAGLRR